ncbi:hypothetical protein [Microbacterium deminutum]
MSFTWNTINHHDAQNLAAATLMDDGDTALAFAQEATRYGDTVGRHQSMRSAIANKSAALLAQGPADGDGNRQ